MKTLEILIEQNALGTVRPMALAAQAPVSTLVPAIVEELKLPGTDLFGNRLVYLLRYPGNGQVLPGETSLEAAGIDSGGKLALDSYVIEGSVAAVVRERTAGPAYRSNFHASATLADADELSVIDLHASTSMPALIRPKKRRWTRRAFLLVGGAVLGASSVGLAYAGYEAYQQYMSNKQNAGMTQAMSAQMRPAQTALPVPTHAQAVLVFSQHTQQVRAVAWSPDGTLLASGANDALALVWNTTGAVQLRQEQSGAVRAIAWSPDGALLASGATNRLTWYNAHSGAQLTQSRHTHTGTITALAWSPQAPYRLVSGATDMKAVVWDATAFQPQVIFMGHSAPIEAASWASDNQTVATASHGGTVRVWAANNAQEVHAPYIDAATPLRAVAFNHASNQLAAGGDDGIARIWNGLICQQPGQGQGGPQCLDMPTRITAQTGALRALAWSPDGRFLATGGDDGMLRLWYPARSQAPLLELNQFNPVMALAWSPDGKRIAAAAGNDVMLWLLM